jgi:CRP-like cAMP-binding protein
MESKAFSTPTAFIHSISCLTEPTKVEVAALFTKEAIKKGENFVSSGEIAKRIAFLEKGIVRAYYRSETGVEYNKHFFRPPSFIGGYASLITNQPNQIIQQALTDCSIWATDYSRLTSLYDKHPDLERAARVLAEHFFVQKEQREVEIVLLDADERYNIFKRDFPELEQLIPQYHIASYLGITPTQLSRIRAKKN